MKQNIFIAALLAGMLVLAGCGGGSSVPLEEETMTGMEEEEEPTPTTLALPGTATIDGGGTTAGGYRGDYDIKAGEDKEIGGVYFECAEGGADCVVTVGSGRNLNSVTYTGGTVTATATNPAVTVRTTQPTVDPADAMQISKAAIQAAIEGRGTIHGLGLDSSVAADAVTVNGVHIFRHADQQQTRLLLRSTLADESNTPGADRAGDNYVFWGHWTKGAGAANNVNSAGLAATTTAGDSTIQPNLVWGGSIPYGGKPEMGNGNITESATYARANGAEIYHRASSSDDWTFGQTGVSLTANFARGRINGYIGVTTETDLFGTAAFPINQIELRRVSFTSDTFSGSTRFTGANEAAVGALVNRGSGSWNGQFFGSSQDRFTGDANEPTHVAGQFSVTRSAQGTGTSRVPGLTVHGTFGASCTLLSTTGVCQ